MTSASCELQAARWKGDSFAAGCCCHYLQLSIATSRLKLGSCTAGARDRLRALKACCCTQFATIFYDSELQPSHFQTGLPFAWTGLFRVLEVPRIVDRGALACRCRLLERSAPSVAMRKTRPMAASMPMQRPRRLGSKPKSDAMARAKGLKAAVIPAHNEDDNPMVRALKKLRCHDTVH